MSTPTTEHRRSGSYDPARTVTGGVDAECARLEAQAELTFGDELPLLRAALGPGPLVEIGSGSGAVVGRLRRALPGTAVLAVDVDHALLVRAAHPGRSVTADAAALPLADASVGTVLLRYVLQHVAAPAAVLAEVARVLRPGGCVVVTDVDQQRWGSAHPTFPELAAVHARLAAAQHRAGGNRSVAAALPGLLVGAGFAEVALHTFTTTNRDRPTSAFAPHLGPERLAPLLATGEVTLAELALATDRWARFLADPRARVELLGFTAVGRRPGGEGGASVQSEA